MNMQRQASPPRLTQPGAPHGEVPGWLRWFANLGLSLSAADCAIASAPPRALVSVSARRRRV
ncbi:MAG: hypothetical protein WC809_12025 [Sinimarinibacterium sp.]